MAGLLVRIASGGADAKLQALQRAVGDMRPAYALIGARIASRIRLCFKLGADPWGTPWAALRFRRGQPLRDTGRLNRSIVSRADSDGVTVGTGVKYAPVHQFGATIVPRKARRLVFPGPNGQLIFARKVTIPARPFMPLRKGQQVVALPPAWSADVVRALRSYFRGVVEKLPGAG